MRQKTGIAVGDLFTVGAAAPAGARGCPLLPLPDARTASRCPLPAARR
jgi:hypothetical protein